MNTTALVSEFLLIGLVPFLAFAIIAFLILDINLICIVKRFENLIPIFSILTIFIIYFLGSLTHRISQIVSRFYSSIIKNVKLKRIFELLNIRDIKFPDTNDTYHDEDNIYYPILEKCSEYIFKKIEYNESLLRVFTCNSMSIPLLVISLFWAYLQTKNSIFLLFFIILIIIEILTIIAAIIQQGNFSILLQKSYELLHQDSSDNNKENKNDKETI